MPGKAKVIPFPAAGGALELKVTLLEIRPAIWRRLRVPGSLTLRELHHVMQIAVGWTDSHLHEFEIDGRRYGMLAPDGDEFGEPPLDEREFTLGAVVRPGARFEYAYDFGDDWKHQIIVEKSPGGQATGCLDGERAAPPEDCGGPLGYARLLEVLAQPRHPEHRDLHNWVGPHFDPERLDLAAINRALRGAGTAAFRRKREQFYDGA